MSNIGVKTQFSYDPNDPSVAVSEQQTVCDLPHARCQEASVAAHKRGGRSEQAQEGCQPDSDLNVHVTINRERLFEQPLRQRHASL